MAVQGVPLGVYECAFLDTSAAMEKRAHCPVIVTRRDVFDDRTSELFFVVLLVILFSSFRIERRRSR